MDGIYAADRLRAEARLGADAPIDVERWAPRLYPVAIVRVDALTVRQIEEWLTARHIRPPDALAWCQDRPLRGGVLAWQGRALLFVDSADDAAEQRYTAAHETAHYLCDHLYPRLDAGVRLGESILEVLDGFRAPTTAERGMAILRRTTLTQMAHLLARDAAATAETAASEREADRFACEAIAPRAVAEAAACTGLYPPELVDLPARVLERYLVQFRPWQSSELLGRIVTERG